MVCALNPKDGSLLGFLFQSNPARATFSIQIFSINSNYSQTVRSLHLVTAWAIAAWLLSLSCSRLFSLLIGRRLKLSTSLCILRCEALEPVSWANTTGIVSEFLQDIGYCA